MSKTLFGVTSFSTFLTERDSFRSLTLVTVVCTELHIFLFFKVTFEITIQHTCSPLNLLDIFRTPIPKNTSWRIFLRFYGKVAEKFAKYKHAKNKKKVCSKLIMIMLKMKCKASSNERNHYYLNRN